MLSAPVGCEGLRHVDVADSLPVPDLVVQGTSLDGAPFAGVDVAVLSLAKQREEGFVPGRSDPLPLLPDDPASLVLQRVRDEAHRFAVRYHRRKRDAESVDTSMSNSLGSAQLILSSVFRARRATERHSSWHHMITSDRPCQYALCLNHLLVSLEADT